jgi:thymidylate synthase ThyX
MEIKYVASTRNLKTVDEMKKFAQVAARMCYSEKDAEELFAEEYNPELTEGRLLTSGHHSPFEHVHITFDCIGIPKILAMILNNERQYVTSEKSARYTQMKEMVSEQKVLYDQWMDRLTPLISQAYPEMQDAEKRDGNIQKLAQENARYMTSVFTPTKMFHTINLRQLNFLIGEFERYSKEKAGSDNNFESRLADRMYGFVQNVSNFRIPGLDNRTNRHMSSFNFKETKGQFSDTYSTQYFMSFAGLAQAHRHRTISYNMQTPELGAPLGFFIPEIIRQDDELVDAWLGDLEDIAKTDFPQAQQVFVRERGNIEDFESKCILRLCGHAQHEMMKNTLETAQTYAEKLAEKAAEEAAKVKSWISPKCQRGFSCKEPCVWGGKRALERIV